MIVKIFKPAKTAMQSGKAKTKLWHLQVMDDSIQTRDPLIGYHGGSSTKNQIKLEFETKEDAINFAKCCVPHFKSCIARIEINLFLITRTIWNM